MSLDPVFAFGTIAAAALIGVGITHTLDTRSMEFPQPATVSEMVILRPGVFDHAEPGEFLKENHPVAAPIVQVWIDAPLEIMKYQVSVVEYARCVADGACKPADPRKIGNVAVTGVSHIDAEAYATWISNRTGDAWRLPTDAEWAYAAGERFRSDIESKENDPNSPARRWLAQYRTESSLGRKPYPEPRVQGAFGTNSKGLADVAGNIWEWTSTCYVHATIASDGLGIASSIDNCGVHVVEGFHRTYMSNFIRDGKSGGCAVGTPPDNLGFRLVRDRSGAVQAALRHLELS
ncbi:MULTISPECIES: formylglycine-generating enzyme family protein [unclassified Mesorhizobium]|uniref:formylglycine-generating enzyme family protein n=1 Tax=unclassified Mesorhizobium TaxID=325217 RepID=UPI0010918F4F|nr:MULTISPECIES: formylglycine-generating enzyme family protein [unclassified Mesorhizobium]TGQ37029.1 formylglycine-generating enzyme family protein [Mesorhizobium sp. M4B.F.Ca.ET.214.01.1.1]TGQ59321.1 formylglycine-generating enzyme family protein [Mesorhizobium sp. M4B.F.Ca.ET.211.01.1.1]TGU34048.1 formylglycine-generating enzyme family protein [Mesorhizobium sp. M4B.F.Ca.ET.150.01.1.1]